ncbi:MAG: hypothetical protein J6P37_09605 [Lachnospiraceae bacterium]|nr:hypothetical protein [Lachnospiraceae bacterium]
MNDLSRENIMVLISLAYRLGWKDSRDGKDLPTVGQLDRLASEIYDGASQKDIMRFMEIQVNKGMVRE